MKQLFLIMNKLVLIKIYEIKENHDNDSATFKDFIVAIFYSRRIRAIR